MQRTSLWLAVRVLALTLAAAVLLLNLATPRTHVSSGDDLVPPAVQRDEPHAHGAEEAKRPGQGGTRTDFLRNGDDRPAAGAPARAGR